MAIPSDLTFGFDADFYRNRYADLTHMSDGEALAHFVKHGHYEGRLQNSVANRRELLRQIPDDGLVLEIGPFGAPQVFGPHVRYADFLSTEELRARAPHHGHDPEKCPEIHYVLRDVDLGSINERFSAVFSSHCIEHQPDLIKHLQDVENILQPDGRYFLAIPDKRYCFDYFIAESTVGDVMAAHRQRRRLHSLRSFVTAFAFGTHNDPISHWAGEHGSTTLRRNGYHVVWDAIALYHRAAKQNEYVDVHGWQFTPKGFHAICSAIRESGLSSLRLTAICPPARNGQEFCAILQRD